MTTAKQPARRARKRAPKPEKLAVEDSKRISIELRQGKDTTEENETIEKDVHLFITDPAYIRVNAGVTKNMGNFESLRVDVSITMPCYREAVEEVFEVLSDKVATLLDNEVDQYLGVEEDE
jgi:hypothetical protein